MKNAHKSLMADPVGVVYGAALGVCLLWSVLPGQRIAITPFIEMDQNTRNGP
ncbi:MAG TPA: hypothetical protein VNI02_02925 [Blastocatellia bacterium]|jgi:hypothetical protein|nr:hypothetical protein [Blastocatellia bacterium]